VTIKSLQLPSRACSLDESTASVWNGSIVLADKDNGSVTRDWLRILLLANLLEQSFDDVTTKFSPNSC
jgi:hypothetical protein